MCQQDNLLHREHFSPCDNLTLWSLLQIDGGSSWSWPAVSCGAKEETHLEGETDVLLRLDQGGDRGGHWDGQVAYVGSLDVNTLHLVTDIFAVILVEACLPGCTGRAAKKVCLSDRRQDRFQSACCKPTFEKTLRL